MIEQTQLEQFNVEPNWPHATTSDDSRFADQCF